MQTRAKPYTSICHHYSGLGLTYNASCVEVSGSRSTKTGTACVTGLQTTCERSEYIGSTYYNNTWAMNCSSGQYISGVNVYWTTSPALKLPIVTDLDVQCSVPDRK